jgi:hypothetical protein
LGSARGTAARAGCEGTPSDLAVVQYLLHTDATKSGIDLEIGIDAADIPVACNSVTADFLVTSPLFNNEHKRAVLDFQNYRNRLHEKAVKATEQTGMSTLRSSAT